MKVKTLSPQEMTEDQLECYYMLCKLFGGAHHVTGRIEQAGPRGICYLNGESMATWDGNKLTLAVIMAHDRCIRFAVEPWTRHKTQLFLHKRDIDVGMQDRHPTLEEQVQSCREWCGYKPVKLQLKETENVRK